MQHQLLLLILLLLLRLHCLHLLHHHLASLLLFLLGLSLLHIEQALADADCHLHAKHVVLRGLEHHWAHVVHLSKQSQWSYQFHQLEILGVIIPTYYWQAILWLELVAVRRVVNDDYVLEGAAHPLHIFHEDAVVKGAVLTEQALWCYPLLVEDVH